MVGYIPSKREAQVCLWGGRVAELCGHFGCYVYIGFTSREYFTLLGVFLLLTCPN
jgi:hypothetical protein